jgi:hypothetical protein
MSGVEDCKVITIAKRETGLLLVNDFNSETSDDDIEIFKNKIS